METSEFDQVFVTHCRPEDSIFGEAGFSIRASSLEDRDHFLHREAINLPPYELPPAFHGGRPTPQEAPVRLAAVPLKSGNFIALMHSVYMETDTRGRPNSYFTHVIFVPEDKFSWKEALLSWGKITWEIPSDQEEILNSGEYFNTPFWMGDWPRGATRKLPKLKSLPKSDICEDWLLEKIRMHFSQEEHSWEHLVDPICTRLKIAHDIDMAREGSQNGASQETSLTGYLIGRKYNHEEEESKLVDKRVGKSIEETYLHLGLIAWLFPQEVLRGIGFSTYEPEKYGVSIALGKLVVGVVHRQGETADDFLATNGIEYFPQLNPAGNNSGVKDGGGQKDIWGDFKRNLKWVFSQQNNDPKKNQEDVEGIYQEVKKESSLDRFLEAHAIYAGAMAFEERQNYCTFSNLISWIEFTFVKDLIRKLCSVIIQVFIEKMRDCNSQGKVNDFKKVFGELRKCISWVTTHSYLTGNPFWKNLQSAPEGRLKEKEIQVTLDFLQEVIKNLESEEDKKNLLKFLEDLFKDGLMRDVWQSSTDTISRLFDFFRKCKKPEAARRFIAEGKWGNIREWASQHLKIFSNDSDSHRNLVALSLLDRTIQAQKPAMDLEEWLKNKDFVVTIMEICKSIERDDQKKCRDFFDWLKYYDKKNLFSWLAKLFEAEEKVPQTKLFAWVLGDEKYLGNEEIKREALEFLFESENPRIIRFLQDWQGFAPWVKARIEEFIKGLDLNSLLFSPVIDLCEYRDFPFKELATAINNPGPQIDQEISELVTAIITIQGIYRDLPRRFDFEAFQKSVGDLADGYGLNKVGFRCNLINHFSEKIAGDKNEDEEWDRDQAEMIFHLTILNGNDWRAFNENWEGHKRATYQNLKRIPMAFLPNGVNKKNKGTAGVLYSWFRFKCIDKLTVGYSTGYGEEKEFRKILALIAQKFRKELTWMGRILGGFSWPETPEGKWFLDWSFLALAIFPTIYYWQRGFTDLTNIFAGPGGENMARHISGAEISFNLLFGATCLYWSFQGLFSPLNSLVPKEDTLKQKYLVGLWGIVGIVLFMFSFFAPALGGPFLPVSLFALFYLGVIPWNYKDGAIRLMERATR